MLSHGGTKMEKLKSATGKVFDCDYFAVMPSPALLYVRILNLQMIDAVRIFSDKDETVQLWIGDTYLAQYTQLQSIAQEGGAVKICLGKG